MSRRPDLRPSKANGAARSQPKSGSDRESLEQSGRDEKSSNRSLPDSQNGQPTRDKLALSRLDWTSLMLLVVVLLTAPLWAATFATPAQIPLLTPDEIAISGEAGIFLGIWTGPLVLLAVSAAFGILVWREWRRPVAIGAVTGLAGAFALLGTWAIIASARNHALYLSLNTLSYLFAALLLGGMVSRLGRDPRGIAAILLTLVIAGSIVAGIGVNEYLNFWREGAPDHRVFSTFLPDFLAGYLLLTLPATLSAFVTVQGRALRMSVGLGLGLQSACLLLTGSRGGVAIAVFTVLIWLGLCWLTDAVRKNLKPIGLGIGIFLLGAVVSLTPTLARFEPVRQTPQKQSGQTADPASAPVPPAEAQDHSSAFRKYTWIGTVQMAIHNPLLGTGTGTFDIAYPHHAETAYTSHAHNSYLQWMGETGIPGVLLLLTGFAAVSAFFVNILLLIRARVREAGSAEENIRPTGDITGDAAVLTSPRIVLAGLGAGFAASLLHSLIDSDWYIIATLLTLSAVLGLLVAQARALAPLATQMPRTLGREFAILGLLVCGFMIWRGGQIGWSRWERAQIGRPNRGLETLEAMRAASIADPFDPEPHLLLAQMLLGRPEEEAELQAAARVSPSGKTFYLLGRYFEGRKAWKQALDAFEQSRSFDPHNLQLLLALAEAQAMAGQPDQARLTYQTIAALEHTPYGKVRAMPERTETDFAVAHAGSGDLAFEMRNWKEAEADYSQALVILRYYWLRRHWQANESRSPDKRRALVVLYAHVLEQMQSVLKTEGRTADTQVYADEQKKVVQDDKADMDAEQKASQTNK